jgi:hypothetical protein
MMRRALITLAVALAGTACAGFAFASAQANAKRPPTLRGGCSYSSPCRYRAGKYQLGNRGVLPGLRVTLPRGWSSTENDRGEFNLVPPGHGDERLFVWLDMFAVKTSGPGHGTTILKNVGRRPQDIVTWLTHNPDFMVVAQPTRARIAGKLRSTTLSVGVSATAKYDDPGCPSNPRCADLFTNATYWGGNFYGIGGDGQVRLYLAAMKRNGHSHTFYIALDASNHANLLRLTQTAKPIIAAMRLP